MPRTPDYKRQEKTILNALFQIRAEIIRENLDGLCHVDWLLRARGADPDAQKVPRPTPRRFKRGHLSRAVLRALRDGPGAADQIAARISNDPTIAPSVRETLRHLRLRGFVVVLSPARRGVKQVWGLAPQGQSIMPLQAHDAQGQEHRAVR